MSLSFLLHMDTFHHHTGIITNYLRWSLSDPEVVVIFDREG